MKCDELTEYTNPTYGSAYYDIDEVDAAIAELKAKLIEKDAKNRKLNRALYKACANWAHYVKDILFRDEHEAEKWSKMETRCRAKAEEYR